MGVYCSSFDFGGSLGQIIIAYDSDDETDDWRSEFGHGAQRTGSLCLGMVGYWCICILVPRGVASITYSPLLLSSRIFGFLVRAEALLLVFTVGSELYTSVLGTHMHREMFLHMRVVTGNP